MLTYTLLTHSTNALSELYFSQHNDNSKTYNSKSRAIKYLWSTPFLRFMSARGATILLYPVTCKVLGDKITSRAIFLERFIVVDFSNNTPIRVPRELVTLEVYLCCTHDNYNTVTGVHRNKYCPQDNHFFFFYSGSLSRIATQ